MQRVKVEFFLRFDRFSLYRSDVNCSIIWIDYVLCVQVQNLQRNDIPTSRYVQVKFECFQWAYITKDICRDLWMMNQILCWILFNVIFFLTLNNNNKNLDKKRVNTAPILLLCITKALTHTNHTFSAICPCRQYCFVTRLSKLWAYYTRCQRFRCRNANENRRTICRFVKVYCGLRTTICHCKWIELPLLRYTILDIDWLYCLIKGYCNG